MYWWEYMNVASMLTSLILIVSLVEPARAAVGTSHLLDRAMLATAYSGNPDLVTAYTAGMARHRLQLAGRASETSLAVPLEPMLLRAEFRTRTWRAVDGSLLQGFAGTGGGFRLTVGNCLTRICAASECADDGWPILSCSDGRKRKISVKDFVTAIFDGVSYRRLSAGPSTD